jgi:hypothetical protein
VVLLLCHFGAAWMLKYCPLHVVLWGPPDVLVCRLSLEGLREAASNKACRKAYHAQLAPWPQQDTAVAAAADADAAVGGVAAAADTAAVGRVAAAAGAVAQPLPWLGPSEEEIRAQWQRVTGDTL